MYRSVFVKSPTLDVRILFFILCFGISLSFLFFMVVFLRLLFGMISKVKTELWWNVSQIYCWRYSLKCFRERERERKKDKWSKILQDPSALGRITGNTMLRGGVSIICSDSANRVCSFWHQPGPLHATHVLSPPSTPGTKGYKGGPQLSPGIVVHFVSYSRNSRLFWCPAKQMPLIPPLHCVPMPTHRPK